MEHNAIQWLGAPSCQRGSYAFYKSVSCRERPDGPARVWRLGEFYFIRCGPQDPVCLAEVTLLWEDQAQHHLLASTRLYFLPEDTPKGRTREHGEDEVLAVSRKMVVRVEDLVRWSCEDSPAWSSSLKPQHNRINGLQKHSQNSDENVIQEPAKSEDDNADQKPATGCDDNVPQTPPTSSDEKEVLLKPPTSCDNDDSQKETSGDGKVLQNPLTSSTENGSNESNEPLKVKTEDDLVVRHGVRVLSYPQYCRYRSLKRRILDEARGAELLNASLLALGGVKILPNTRLMFCRDTFNHPTLESNASFSWQFSECFKGCPSISLRGRPRKRKGRDESDSPTSSQSESWIERMKENVMGSVEVGCEGSWLPHPEEQLFLDQLFIYMERNGSPIHKVPNLGFKKIDLFLMYSVVKRLGGYKKVTIDRLWKVVYNELGGCPSSTSAATCTRRHYERLMLPYEEHLRAGGTEFKIPDLPIPMKPRGIRGRKPLHRGRKPGPKPKEKKLITPAPPSPTIESANGPVPVKRGRGRPPGTRNKTTLLAQAKLLAQQTARVKVTAESQLHSHLLLPARGVTAPPPLAASSTQRLIQPALVPPSMPLTPDLSPMSGPFLPFLPKPKDQQPDRPEPSSPAAAAAPSGLLLSALPRHFVGGSPGSGFSPVKGVCPLDVFRNRLNLQRVPESPALTPQDRTQPQQQHRLLYTIQPMSGTPETPHPNTEQPPPQPQPLLQQPHTHCSGCPSVDESAQRGVRTRPPPPLLPPLRVLPLNLDCSVQVCELMRTRLGSPQFQTFTRRLSEALSQDLGSKTQQPQQPTLPCTPCSPVTPPPEQALPLNLSKRFTVTKRPSTDGIESSPQAVNGNTDQPPSKKARVGLTEQGEDLSLDRSISGGSGSGSGLGEEEEEEEDVEMRNQEEPADLSSPRRIRAFLLGLPPFKVKFDDDLNGMKFGKFLAPVPARVEAQQRVQTENGEGGVMVKKEPEVVQMEPCETEKSNNKLQQSEAGQKSPMILSVPGPAELKRAEHSNTDTHCF